MLCKKKSSRPRFTALSFKITIANHGLRFRTSNLIVDPKCSHDTSSLRTAYRSQRLFMLRMKSHFSLISSQLLPKSQSLTLDCDFVPLTWKTIHSVHRIQKGRHASCVSSFLVRSLLECSIFSPRGKSGNPSVKAIQEKLQKSPDFGCFENFSGIISAGMGTLSVLSKRRNEA